MAPQGRTEVLSRVPKCKTVVMCYTEKMHVLGKLHLGRSYWATGHKFNVKESISIYEIRGLHAETHLRQVIY